MKSKLDRIISLATLVAAVTAIVLVLKRPAPVVQPQAPSVAQHAQSADQSPSDISERPPSSDVSAAPVQAAPSSTPSSSPQPATTASASAQTDTKKTGTNLNSGQLSSMLEHMLGGGSAGSASLDSKMGEGEPNIKDQQVSMDGDVVHGKFLTEIAGKDVWVTISGHMGEKDGFATFDPTELKVGDTEVPVSLVNPLLQKKMAEQRDKLKIPSSAQ